MGLKFGVVWSSESVSIGTVILKHPPGKGLESEKETREKQCMIVSSEWSSRVQEGNLITGSENEGTQSGDVMNTKKQLFARALTSNRVETQQYSRGIEE